MSQGNPFLDRFKPPPAEPRQPPPPGLPIPRHLAEENLRRAETAADYRAGEDASALIHREGYKAALRELLQQADDAARPQPGESA